MGTLTIVFPKMSGYMNSRKYYNYMSFGVTNEDLPKKYNNTGISISELVRK